MKVGIIGPEKSVEMVVSVIKDYFPDIDYRVYIREKVEQVGEVLEDALNATDGLLFTGIALQGEAEKLMKIEKPYEATIRNDTSLIKAFWEIREENQPFGRISLDIVDESLLEIVNKEIGLKINKVYSMPYDSDKTERDYINRHLELWNQGKVDVVLSALRSTYDELKEKGIPVYRLDMTTPMITLSMNNLINRIKTNDITANQLAILLLQIKNMKEDLTDRYDNLLKLNQVEKKLIYYLREVQGSLFRVGHDKWIVFGTRRTLADRKILKLYAAQMVEFEKENIIIHTGMGFGHTGWSAEYKAELALDLARKNPAAAFFIVDENSNVQGPIQDCMEQTYELAVSDRRMNELARRIGISATYLSKVVSIMEKYEITEFSSDTLGQYLGITQRSARRILDKFLDADCARVVTNAVTKGVGRPKKIVEITIDAES